MEVIILGSGSPLPHPERAGPATLIKVKDKNYLFDCGRGVLMRAAAVSVGAPMLDGLFLTHMHSDHTTDYNDVITTRWIMSPKPNTLMVYGPEGVELFTERTLLSLGQDIGYRLAHHADLNEGPRVVPKSFSGGEVLAEDGIRITAESTDHNPVHPTLGFRIESDEKVIAIAGDTIPCKGLDTICQNADIYVQTVIRSDIIANAPMERMRDVIDYHSDVRQAGETAQRCNVNTLILNHCVPPPRPGQEDDWAAAAREVFNGNIVVSYDLFQLRC